MTQNGMFVVTMIKKSQIWQNSKILWFFMLAGHAAMKTQCMHLDSSVSPTGNFIVCGHFFHSGGYFGDQVHLQFYGVRIPNICKHLVFLLQ